MSFFAESATKRESHHHIFSTLGTGIVKSLRASHVVNGGLFWRNEAIGGGESQEMTTHHLLKLVVCIFKYFLSFICLMAPQSKY